MTLLENYHFAADMTLNLTLPTYVFTKVFYFFTLVKLDFLYYVWKMPQKLINESEFWTDLVKETFCADSRK